MKDQSKPIRANFLGEIYKKEDNRTEDANLENPKDVKEHAGPYHQTIRPESGIRNPEKAWHEKWWGDIIIGLGVGIFIFISWLITTPNAWCKLKVC